MRARNSINDYREQSVDGTRFCPLFVVRVPRDAQKLGNLLSICFICEHVFVLLLKLYIDDQVLLPVKTYKYQTLGNVCRPDLF